MTENQEDLEAVYQQGVKHYRASGNGVEATNIAKTVECWERAAEGGHIEAMYNLGSILHSGLGNIPCDSRRAVHYWEKSALGGSVLAMFNLGVVYADGYGEVAADLEKALNYSSD